MKRILLILCVYTIVASLMFVSCKKDDPDGGDDPMDDPMDDPIVLPPGATYLTPNPQPLGDVAAGYDYLVSGNYISSGIPYDIFTTVFPDEENVLGRTGDNATLAPEYTAITHSNGIKVVTANCLQCHGSYLNGEYVVGLGNINADFTTDQSGLVEGAEILMGIQYADDAPEWEAFDAFAKGSEAVGPYIVTDVVGMNPADQLFAILAAHRDKDSLEWQEELNFDFPSEVVGTDVPPWWVLKKKNAPLYSGIGRGSYAKLFMAASTLTLENLEEAEEVEAAFDDVISFIQSIEAPPYPNEVNEDLALEGKTIFESTCSGCHGTYGADWTYPNLLIDIDYIGTDAAAVNGGGTPYQSFLDWFNDSWFANSDNPGSLENTNGYVAQPLDGIWATAPYLHNASVPTLSHLLNSETRPTYWRRTADSAYDETNVGWEFTEETSKVDKYTHDATKFGYGNQGHTYGDGLTEDERMAVIEYLKTI